MNEIFFYHIVPEDLKGTELVPLNSMKGLDSDLHQNKVEKYKGREWILNRRIDVLNCLWNDVVHMTAVRPTLLKTTMFEQGLLKVSQRKQKYFKIPLSRLEPSKLCAFYVKNEAYNLIDEITDENIGPLRKTLEPLNVFELFNISKIDFYSTINILTKKYFNFVSRSVNKNFMPYQFVPHILYKGTISLEGIEIVEF